MRALNTWKVSMQEVSLYAKAKTKFLIFQDLVFKPCWFNNAFLM